MAVHLCRAGYTFRADTQTLFVDPGPRPITLSRDELAQLGLQPRDDYRIPIEPNVPREDVIGRILSALNEVIQRCHGLEEVWMAQDLRRAMVLIGGLDEQAAQRILDQEGV